MVSVIIPVYNGAIFLKEAIDSIVRQNIPDIEIIIVDDGSTDSTKEVVMSLPYPNINYIYKKNSGPSAARNAGIAAAHRNFIAFLDQDDQWPDGKLATQLDFLEKSGGDAVGGLIQYNYMPGSEYRKEQLGVEAPLFNVQLGTWLVSKQAMKKIGPFNEDLRASEDQDWLLRMRERGMSIHILDKVMLYYRIHPGNATRHKTLKDLEVLKALKLSLDRRRGHQTEPLKPLSKIP